MKAKIDLMNIEIEVIGETSVQGFVHIIKTYLTENDNINKKQFIHRKY